MELPPNLKSELRRLWECPVCKRRERTDGGVTFCFCECGTKQEGGRPVVMKLVADGPQRVVPGIARERVERVEEQPAAAEAPELPTRSVSEEPAPNDGLTDAPG
jgi:hypothetical protein